MMVGPFGSRFALQARLAHITSALLLTEHTTLACTTFVARENKVINEKDRQGVGIVM